MNPTRGDAGLAATTKRIHEHIARVFESAQSPERAGVRIGSIKKYFILSTPRTGSTLFSSGLERNGLGWPAEWFNRIYMEQAAAAFGSSGLNINDYIKTIVLGSYNPALNVFGVKFHVQHYLMLKQHGFDLFDIGFDHGYYIFRRNKVKQAYSIAKSTRTGFWSREAEIEAGHVEPLEVDLTAAELCRSLTDTVVACDFADTSLRGSISRVFCFEDLIGGGYADALASVFGDFGIDAEGMDLSLPTERQSGGSDQAKLQAILRGLGLQLA